MAGYRTFDVQFEHTTENSDTVRQNRRVITVWGDSEFKVRSEIMHQNPEFKDVNIIEMVER